MLNGQVPSLVLLAGYAGSYIVFVQFPRSHPAKSSPKQQGLMKCLLTSDTLKRSVSNKMSKCVMSMLLLRQATEVQARLVFERSPSGHCVRIKDAA